MARSYRVTLQCPEYTERHMPENNNNIWKIAIEHTSVGLAHAHPKYLEFISNTLVCSYTCYNYVHIQIEVYVHSSSSTTGGCCSTFKLSQEDSYQLQRTNCLVPAVHAAELEREASWDMSLRNALTGFMVTCFCTIYLVSTTSTKTNSNSWVKTCLP